MSEIEEKKETTIKLSGNADKAMPNPPRVAIAMHAFDTLSFDVYFNHMFALAHWSRLFDIVLVGKRGLQAAVARNMLVDEAIDAKCSHIFFLDVDHIVPINTLNLLMELGDEAIVSGLVCKKGFGFPQVVWNVTKDGTYIAVELPIDGRVYDVGVCAFGCTLINLGKLQKIDKPYFRDTCDIVAGGSLTNIRSDINLCNMFRMNNEKIWVDTRVLVGHDMGGGLVVYPHNAPTLNHAMKIVEDSVRLKEGQNGFYYK